MTRVTYEWTRPSVARTINQLGRVVPSIGRRALRTGVFRVGSKTVRQLKAAAPRGRTRNVVRSMAKKDIRNAKKGVYLTMAGSNKRRISTPRQVASTIRKFRGLVSLGMSGRNQPVPLHFLEAGTRAHVIRPKRAKRLVWNIGRGNQDIPTRTAPRVIHPGHRGTGFVDRTERRFRQQRITDVNQEIQDAVIKMARVG
ncbi:MAG: hypothetical protein AAFU85_11555 [Planctomycetota bacterium]